LARRAPTPRNPIALNRVDDLQASLDAFDGRLLAPIDCVDHDRASVVGFDPAMTLISVDLPEPFSPAGASAWPRAMSKP